MATSLSIDQLVRLAVKKDSLGNLGFSTIAETGALATADLSNLTQDQILRSIFSDNGDGTYGLNLFGIAGGGGSGTVTTASVVSANGFTGTVANPTTTPAITVATSVTGLLKGNGTAVSAVVSGTDIKTVNGASLLGSGDITISTPLTTTTVGTATFQYEILTGTPSITYTKTGGSGVGTMAVSGGTLKLRRFVDDILTSDTASSAIRLDLVGTGTSYKLARPTPTKYTLNATDALADASTSGTTSNQIDIDNTPTVKYGNIILTSHGSMSVRLDNVTTDTGIDLKW